MRIDNALLQQRTQLSIAIVGGGIAGSTIALRLCEENRLAEDHIFENITLFESKASLVNGPPFCHLHAGGNLYREISDAQCIVLLKQSIDTVRANPHCFEKRPTVLFVPKDDTMAPPSKLIERLLVLQDVYANLAAEDPANQVLGDPGQYFSLFSQEDLQRLRNITLDEEFLVTDLKESERWLLPVVTNLASLDDFKYPVILVQEFGWNMFRQAAACSLALEDFTKEFLNLQLNSSLTDIQRTESGKWQVFCKPSGMSEHEEHLAGQFDVLINTAGWKSGSIDDLVISSLMGSLHVDIPDRMTECKASYLTENIAVGVETESDLPWPEIIFHGERGTPKGMIQMNPMCGGYFQIHGMTKNVTLFDGGLVRNTHNSAQPVFKNDLGNKLSAVWEKEDLLIRTGNAVDLAGKYFVPRKHLQKSILPGIKLKVLSSLPQPFYGAVQIPGTDPNFRATNGISFLRNDIKSYVRIEIVKASNAISCAEDLINLLYNTYFGRTAPSKIPGIEERYRTLASLPCEVIIERAREICIARSYPLSLAEPYPFKL